MADKNKSKSTGRRSKSLRGNKKKYYESLLLLREEVLKQMKFHSDEALKNSDGGLNSISNHMADFGSDNFLHGIELDMMTNEGDVIEMIDEAINRLFEGGYGKCLDCGCKINPERLEAKPYAQLCVKCKSNREENGGLRPDMKD